MNAFKNLYNAIASMIEAKICNMRVWTTCATLGALHITSAPTSFINWASPSGRCSYLPNFPFAKEATQTEVTFNDQVGYFEYLLCGNATAEITITETVTDGAGSSVYTRTNNYSAGSFCLANAFNARQSDGYTLSLMVSSTTGATINSPGYRLACYPTGFYQFSNLLGSS